MANHQINITTNGTTTLATAEKWCDRNIDVNVNVASSGGGGGSTITFYTGSAAPSATLGKDDDLYLQTV